MRNSSRTWLLRENQDFAASLPAGSRVLDAGAGIQPYRHLFRHCDYESADFEQVDKGYEPSTYVCDLASIPVEDGRFDAVILNQVMEHLSEPRAVLRELRRVLKPGGRMICTAPLFYEEHEQPYDFYRYTQFAWKHMMQAEGYELERLDWLEGYFGTVAYQLRTASRYLLRRPHKIAPGLLGWTALPAVLGGRVAFAGLARLFTLLDERQRFTGSGFPKNYLAIVRKPLDETVARPLAA